MVTMDVLEYVRPNGGRRWHHILVDEPDYEYDILAKLGEVDECGCQLSFENLGCGMFACWIEYPELDVEVDTRLVSSDKKVPGAFVDMLSKFTEERKHEAVRWATAEPDNEESGAEYQGN